MSVLSVLKTIGKDALGLLNWLGSQKGQAAIASGEAVVEALYPPSAGLIAIANLGLTEIFKVEALGQAAAQAAPAGSIAKLAAVVSQTSPEIIAYAEQHGFATPTGDQVQAAINALVAFSNSFTAATPAVKA